ncbi:MAG: hypothetical protein AAB739_01000 [Patescibacteria group bacterium]
MDFFTQFEKLRNNVPRLAIMNFKATNSPFCNFTYQAEDCYYSIGSDFLKNSHYNYWGYHNNDCIDCSYCRSCENCYECIDCKNCSGSGYLQDCDDCVDSNYCFDCQSLKNCFACVELWRKQYYIYNKPYTKEEYLKTVEKLKKKSPEELRKLFKEVKKTRPHIYMHQNRNKDQCSGDYIYNSKSCVYCFDIENCTESLYLNNAINCSDCIDMSFAGEASIKHSYEIMSGMGLSDCMFCSVCWYGKTLEYCEYCFECENCFGCIGLKNKKFYIFNMPYKPADYFKKVEEIKAEMKRSEKYGEWFPSSYRIEDTKACEDFICIEHAPI